MAVGLEAQKIGFCTCMKHILFSLFNMCFTNVVNGVHLNLWLGPPPQQPDFQNTKSFPVKFLIILFGTSCEQPPLVSNRNTFRAKKFEIFFF